MVAVQIPPACDFHALTKQQRHEHEVNARWLWGQLLERRPLEDALALRFPDDSHVFRALTRFVDLERVCCPFFTFELRVVPQQGLWLRLTGDDSVVRFAHEYVPDAM